MGRLLKVGSKFIVFIVSLLICQLCFAEPSLIQRIQIEPLESGISFNTIELSYAIGWVTAPTVEMVGRKEMLIMNTSTVDNIYISDISGSSVILCGTIYPRQMAKFKISSDLHLYISASSVVNVLNIINAEVWEIR